MPFDLSLLSSHLSSWWSCPWDIGSAADDRQVFKPRSFRLQSPRLSHNDRNALCIIRKKGEVVETPGRALDLEFLNFYAQNVPVSHKPQHTG